MSLINREKLCVNREKSRHQKSTIFSPLVFHRLRPHESWSRLSLKIESFSFARDVIGHNEEECHAYCIASAQGFCTLHLYNMDHARLPTTVWARAPALACMGGGGGAVFLLTVGVFLLAVKLLCLQALIRRTFPL